MRDCGSGKFTLYKSFVYTVDYITTDPLVFEKTESPDIALAGEKVDINVHTINPQNRSIDGEIKIFNERNMIASKEISTGYDNHLISFNLPEKESFNRYEMEFHHDEGIVY